jgi:NADH pyrophosphatase NudC (nudix superfamily)
MSETTADLEALIRKAEKLRECAQCGKHLDHRERPRSVYCSEKCPVVFRRRRR